MKRTVYRKFSAALVALACAAAQLTAFDAGVARADGNADEADLHFQIAAEAYSKADFRLALEHFLLSNRLVPNKNVVFNVARTYEQLRRFADAHRYYVDALEGETNPQTSSAIQDAIKRIAPNVAVLRVESDPPGATVYIDRTDLGSRGRAPRPLAIAEGKYRVIVELEGYEPATLEGVEAKTGSETSVPFKLKRIVGSVAVTLDGAPDAAVRVDDEQSAPVCTAPCTFDLAPGRHLIYFERQGFQAPPRQLNVVAKETVKTNAVLTPLTGSVVVQADERDAVVEIDGKPAGFTPSVIQGVSVGERKVRVTLRGYAPVERAVTVKPNEQSQILDLKLVPLRQVAAASRFTENIEDAPSSVTIIDGQELRAFGYPTIAEALRGVRGIAIHNDRVYAGTNVRGLGQPNDYGNRLLVLSDGAVFNDDITNQGFIGNEARTDLGDVDRIEIVRGPGSLLYGTGAMSGVVNLVPRSKEEPSGVNARGGTWGNGAFKGAVRGGYANGEKAGFWVSAGGSRADGSSFALQPRDPALGNSLQFDQVDFFRAASTSGRAWIGDLTAQWAFTQRQQQIPIGIFGTSINDPRTSYFDQRVMGEVRYEPKINKYFQILARAYANHYHYKGNYVYAPEPEPAYIENYNGTWFGLEARGIITPTESLRLTVGVNTEFHVETNLRGDDGYGTPESIYLDQSQPFNLIAPYGVIDWQIAKSARLSFGGRGDFFTGKDVATFPSIRGAFIVKPWTGGVIKLMGGSSFRAPSVYEQFYTDGGVAQIPGNSDLLGTKLEKPEKILTGELELSQRFLEDWVALASGWVSKVDDVIVTAEIDPETGLPTAGTGVVQYQNSVTPQLGVGIDLELRREWRQGWMLSATYSYQRATFVEIPAGDPLALNPRVTNAPEHLASLRGVVPIVADLASLGVRLTVEAPRRAAVSSDETTRGAAVADITLSGNVKRFGVGYVVGVYNVADQQYSLPTSEAYLNRFTPQNGRTFLANVSVTYP